MEMQELQCIFILSFDVLLVAFSHQEIRHSESPSMEVVLVQLITHKLTHFICVCHFCNNSQHCKTLQVALLLEHCRTMT
ncbi:hypothetical protein KP509_05G053800 [Ceratopteris richardii]|uniref:Secreted protein n=1 Tax=Ceratopteris richardii TaxID=49495 RepID=A0A8T2UTY2_CERRI|nr:hypothetical protein KP509_05G053800 [Ceratopteris richardii]